MTSEQQTSVRPEKRASSSGIDPLLELVLADRAGDRTRRRCGPPRMCSTRSQIVADLRNLVGDQQDADAARGKLADRSRRCPRLLPMSTPTVGRIEDQHLAGRWPATWRARRAAGCRRRAAAPGRSSPGILMRSRSTQSAASVAPPAGLDPAQPRWPAGRATARTRLSLDRLAHVEAEIEPVLGDVGDAGADRVLVRRAARSAVAAERGSRRHRAGSCRTGTAPARSGRRPSRPVRPSTSPRRERERDVRRTRPRASARCTSSSGSAAPIVARGAALCSIGEPGHQLADPPAVDLAGG